MLGTAGDFPACQRGFKETQPFETAFFSEDHYSDLNGAEYVALQCLFNLQSTAVRCLGCVFIS